MAQELPERSDMEIAYWLLPTDWQSCRWGSTEHKIRAAVPGSYEIFIFFFFALCPKSTWEQWKLFSTRFSGTAIMIIMISISIAIAAGLFSGQFGSPGEEGAAARSRHASLGQNWGREQKKKNTRHSFINKARDQKCPATFWSSGEMKWMRWGCRCLI